MARELQDRVLAVLEQATGRRVYAGPTPNWLQPPRTGGVRRALAAHPSNLREADRRPGTPR